MELDSRFQTDRKTIDLIVVYMANFINEIMTILFVARIAGFPLVEYILGIVAMMLGFSLGYLTFFNKKNKRNNWAFLT